MKSFIKSASVLLVAIFFSFSSKADKGSVITSTFKVWGNCEMCKEHIENAVDVKGVKTAAWDMNTGTLSVTFDTTKITLDQLHRKIADAGYDTEKIKASDAAYGKLPQCCQYKRRPE